MAMTEYQPQNGSSYWKGAIIGGLIGAAAALLLAPKAGRELRGELKVRAGDAYDVVKRQAGDLAETAQSAVKAVSTQAGTIAGKVQDLASTAIRSNPDLADKAHDAVDAVSEKAADKAHDYVNKAENSVDTATNSFGQTR
jgi:gas vesicle protein